MSPRRRTLRIFVSFEFDKDSELKNGFYAQAEEHTEHCIHNCSLNEAYPTKKWVEKARSAIRSCHVVVVLVGQDTHNAPGVKTEVKIARGMGKPVFQIRPQGRPYKGVPYLDEPIPWRWTRINRKLDEVRG